MVMEHEKRGWPWGLEQLIGNSYFLSWGLKLLYPVKEWTVWQVWMKGLMHLWGQ
jgi:hypothetical protein